MEYGTMLGADLKMIHLQYAKALANSLLLDLTKTTAANLTDARYALMRQKALMLDDTMTQINASAALVADKYSKGTLDEIGATIAKINPLLTQVAAWAATSMSQEPGFVPAAYNAPVQPFMAPPTVPAGLAFSDKVIMTFTPATVAMVSQYGGAYVPQAAKGGIPTVALIGAAAVAAFFLMR